MLKGITGFKSALIALTFMFAGATQAGIIDFEDYTAGTIIDDEYFLSHGVTIRGVNSSYNPDVDNIGVVFDSSNYTGGDDDLAAPFYNDALEAFNPGNILIIHEHPTECDQYTCGDDPDDEGSRPAGYFDIVFSSQVTLNSIDFFDIEYREAQMPKFEIEFYADSLFDQVIMDDSFYVPVTGGDNTWGRESFGVENVMAMRIYLGGSGAIDNINFTVQHVPEPSTWLIFALGGVAFLRKRGA